MLNGRLLFLALEDDEIAEAEARRSVDEWRRVEDDTTREDKPPRFRHAMVDGNIMVQGICEIEMKVVKKVGKKRSFASVPAKN